jgi:hypothetical protein
VAEPGAIFKRFRHMDRFPRRFENATVLDFPRPKHDIPASNCDYPKSSQDDFEKAV